MLELSARWRRFGYRRLHILLKREGFAINHKKVYRLYKAAGLTLSRKRKKKVYAKRGKPETVRPKANVRWSMDFVSDRTRYGRKLRIMTLIDEATRECPALEVDTSLTGQKVSSVLNRVALFRGLPQEILTDNGTEFTSKAMMEWSLDHHVDHIFTDPGHPIQNGYIESFNGKLRDECLNQNWFNNLYETRQIIEAWRVEYNTERPHSGLGALTPTEFAAKLCKN